jgi:hypothetical protein
MWNNLIYAPTGFAIGNPAGLGGGATLGGTATTGGLSFSGGLYISGTFSGGVSIGGSIGGSTHNAVLYADGSGNLANIALGTDQVPIGTAGAPTVLTATSAKTASTLVKRDGTGGAAFTKVTVDNSTVVFTGGAADGALNWPTVTLARTISLPDKSGTVALTSDLSGFGSGTVTSVDISAPASILVAGGGPVTTSGTLSLGLANQSANLVWAGPTTGAATQPTFRSLVAADISFVVPNASGGLGANISGSTAGSILYAASGAVWNVLPPGSNGNILTLSGGLPAWTAAGTGTVTSVTLTVPSILSVAGSPITTSGTLAVTLATQAANLVFAGPTSGGAAGPTFRALVSADLPAGTGTVTSVGLVLPSILTVSGSPVTTSGNLSATLATQTANTVFAGPATGGAVAPTFRPLGVPDLPGPAKASLANLFR